MPIELITYLIVLNIAGFIFMGADKSAARKKKWRVPESILIFIAAAGGVAGSWAGMYVFHHKTKKPLFVASMPVILAVWALILYFRFR